MSTRPADETRFVTAPLGRLFLFNALPMTLVMSMSGLLNVVDAAFLGHFVGAGALTAVSLGFPLVMITIALSSLVSGGMSSLLARHLGAGARGRAEAVFAQAHGLALIIAAGLIVVFALAGPWALRQMAGAPGPVAQMAWTYLVILIWATPVQFWLGIHADALRNEGRAGTMALLSLLVTLANIALDYLLIVGLDLGVAGSALGTVAAQAIGLGVLVALRGRDRGLLPLGALARHRWWGGWRPILALGAPLSLSFIGIALVSTVVIATLKLTLTDGYAQTIAAYGIVTRIFSFTFLPQMAIALATQSIVGHNVGARQYARSDAALRIALTVAVVYCATVELVLLLAAPWIGAGFVGAPEVVAQVATILRPMVALYLFSGPVLVLALYFQAAGLPARTAGLTLIKPFVLSPVLVVGLGALIGPGAIWFAMPIADVVVVLIVLRLACGHLRGARGPGFGLPQGTPDPAVQGARP